jgi:hypothetical protein
MPFKTSESKETGAKENDGNAQFSFCLSADIEDAGRRIAVRHFSCTRMPEAFAWLYQNCGDCRAPCQK